MFLPKLCEGFTRHDIDEAEEDVNLHFGRKMFNRAGWEYILNKHGGIPPLRFMGMREGTLLPIKDKKGQHIPVVTVENTDPACFWLPGHVETPVLRSIWYPTTVATNSFDCKVEILKARMLSCDSPLAGLEFALHDFGARGVSSQELAEIGGAGTSCEFHGQRYVRMPAQDPAHLSRAHGCIFGACRRNTARLHPGVVASLLMNLMHVITCLSNSQARTIPAPSSQLCLTATICGPASSTSGVAAFTRRLSKVVARLVVRT